MITKADCYSASSWEFKKGGNRGYMDVFAVHLIKRVITKCVMDEADVRINVRFRRFGYWGKRREMKMEFPFLRKRVSMRY